MSWRVALLWGTVIVVVVGLGASIDARLTLAALSAAIEGESRRLVASIIPIEDPNMLPRLTATTSPITASKGPWVGEEIRTTTPRQKAS
jgi:hypothetical protein